MAEIIHIIELLVEKGHAYPAENGDVYYSARSFKPYGKLGGFDIDDLESGARIDVDDIKRDPLDFALWKATKPGEPSWDSPWGKGRPGWHIECSAMVDKYLGKTIDIHCGGQDLTFPHHENEIAQSEAAFGVPFCRAFLHNGYINVDNKKMSKSLGNFFTVRDAAAQYGYAAIRFFLISSHYRSPINFSAESLTSAKASLERLYNCENAIRQALEGAKAGEVREEVIALDSFKDKFVEALDDDFNTADAVSALFELTRSVNILLAKGDLTKEELERILSLWVELAGLLGFLAPKIERSAEDEEIDALVLQRSEAKKARDFATADKIRDDLKARGIILEDTAQGTKWKRA
jgi:cysteinyl-tRNA synthetase